jgi:archaellum component FlaF (FlaF/FlaG flagellin family)
LLNTPNGGEYWFPGSTYEILWDDFIDENVNIELYNNGQKLKNIDINTPSDGSYIWEVPADLAPGSNYTISICSVNDPSIADISDGFFTIETGIINDSTDEQNLPINYKLFQNYPNPFNPSTTIKYQIPTDSRIILELYSLSGKKITRLVDEELKAGSYSYTLDANKYNLTSGVYFYRFTALNSASANFVATKKLILLK